MSDNDTLMAHIVPTLTNQVAVAATNSLAFVLNKSAPCRQVLDELVRDAQFQVEPIARLSAEETLSPSSRLDLVGYDQSAVRRLLIEAKFWAGLGKGQASGYFKLLTADGPGVLLFIVPKPRVSSIWREIGEEMKKAHWRMSLVTKDGDVRAATVHGSDKRLMLVSWRELLGRMLAAAESEVVRSDILQLSGLTHRIVTGVRPELTGDALASDFKERDSYFREFIGDTVVAGVQAKLLRIDNLKAGDPRRYYQRYFRFWDKSAPFVGLGVEYTKDLYERTPLWLYSRTEDWKNLSLPPETVKSPSGKRCKTPISLRPDATYAEGVADVLEQLRELSVGLRDDPAKGTRTQS